MAPGTAGAAAGVGLFLLFARLPLGLFALTTGALTALAIWAADRCEALFGTEDDGRIVVDEIVGQLLALAPLLVLRPTRPVAATVTGFVLFRVFDVWKPGPVRQIERNVPGGAGVVMDDVLAGVFAAFGLAAALWLTGAVR